MEVLLRGQPVDLAAVERDDEDAVIGITPTGKRLVARRDIVKAEPVEAPDAVESHPYRVYVGPNAPVRMVGPSFADAEAWLLGNVEEPLTFRREDGYPATLTRAQVVSILSAIPSVPDHPED